MATRCCWRPESSTRAVTEAVGEPELVEQAPDERAFLAARLRAPQLEGQDHVADHVERRHEVDAWNTEPIRSRRSSFSALSSSAPISRSPSHTSPLDGEIEPGEQVHQRGLAAAGGAHDRDELAAAHREVDAAQRVDGGVAGAVVLGDRMHPGDRVGAVRRDRRVCSWLRRGRSGPSRGSGGRWSRLIREGEIGSAAPPIRGSAVLEPDAWVESRYLPMWKRLSSYIMQEQHKAECRSS